MVTKSKKHGSGTPEVAANTVVAPTTSTTPAHKVRHGHAAPLPVPEALGGLKRLRVGHLMNLLAISHATLYARLKTGAIPRPDGKDGKRPYWRTSTVRDILSGPDASNCRATNASTSAGVPNRETRPLEEVRR